MFEYWILKDKREKMLKKSDYKLHWQHNKGKMWQKIDSDRDDLINPCRERDKNVSTLSVDRLSV